MTIHYAGEGPTDAAILRRLILVSGGLPGTDYTTHRGGRGKSSIDRRLPGFDAAARAVGSKTIVLRDMDRDAACAPSLRRKLLPDADRRLCFRIAVREAEAWLLADPTSLSSFLKISESLVPSAPEELESPKLTLVDLARRSRSSAIRRDLVPDPKSGISVGRGYVWSIQEFVSTAWDVEKAVRENRSPSLTKAVSALKKLVAL